MGEELALERLAVDLSRKVGASWRRRLLGAPPTRTLRFPAGVRGSRPTWKVGGRELTVEAAVLAATHSAGRKACFAENSLWSGLFALALRPLYWLPVAGQLPSSRMTGPLDLGSPAFYQRRRAEADALLMRMRDDGPAPLCEGWGGEWLSGLSRPEEVLSLAPHIPGPLAAAVLGRLCREGRPAASGLPDLLILPGSPVPLPEALPCGLPPGALLVEVKGPGDVVQDAQALWHDFLLTQGISVEIWHVMQ